LLPNVSAILYAMLSILTLNGINLLVCETGSYFLKANSVDPDKRGYGETL